MNSSVNSFFELGGLTSGAFDQLRIAGDLNLDGNLLVSLINGFNLSANEQFLIGDIGGNLTGQFNGLGEGSLVGNFGGQNLFTPREPAMVMILVYSRRPFPNQVPLG